MNFGEINFTVDKYNKPVYLPDKDSLAQIITNALFSKSGNTPSRPHKFVDIEQYLYKSVDSINESRILQDLRDTCGGIVADTISTLSFTPIHYKGMDAAILIIKLAIGEEEDAMAIYLARDDDGYVRYKYSFINDDVPVKTEKEG